MASDNARLSHGSAWARPVRRLVDGLTRALRILICALPLAAAAIPAHAADGAAASTATDDAQAYNNALLALRNGRSQAAIELLSGIVARHPEQQGALLDLALAYCQADLPFDAQALFERLAARPDLPPAIGVVINFYREGACKPTTPHWRTLVAAGLGQARNLNQAPDLGFLFLAPLGVTLQLSDDSRPRRDSFWSSELTLTRQPLDRGLGLRFSLQHLGYGRQHGFDSTLAQGAASWRDYIGEARLDAQGAIAHQTFGSQAYVTSASGSASLLWPVFALANEPVLWRAGPAVQWQQSNYPNLPDYRARQMELRGRLQYQPRSNLLLSGDLGWAFDHALGARPGGNRTGPVLQGSLQWFYGAQHSVELFYRQVRLPDDQPYSPVFFGDLKRSGRQASVYAAWRYRITPEWQWRLEGRVGTSRDVVPLFNFSASSFALMLEWTDR